MGREEDSKEARTVYLTRIPFLHFIKFFGLS